MKVIICATAAEVAALGAGAVRRLLDTTPGTVLGLATGSSPTAIYQQLLGLHHQRQLSFIHAKILLLDKYVGSPPQHLEHYRRVIGNDSTDHIDVPAGTVHAPTGDREDIPAAAGIHERATTAAGGIGLQILGIGTDGNLAVNEPGSSLSSRTHLKSLTEQTRRDNARFFDHAHRQAPRHAITQGLGTTRDARHLVLLSAGTHKVAAVRQLMDGPVSARWRATVLKMHERVTVLLDEAAAQNLELGDYYRQTYASKPHWQRP